jgi:hypothetical protein
MGNDVGLYFPLQYFTALSVPPLTGENSDSTCALIAFALLVICIFFILLLCPVFIGDTQIIGHALHIVYNFLHLFSFIFQLIIFSLLYKALQAYLFFTFQVVLSIIGSYWLSKAQLLWA